MKRLYLLDASVFIFKSYFAMPDAWFSEEGYPLNAVFGYANGLMRFLERERPVYLAAAFDESLFQGFRHKLYPAYKANRELPDELLSFQLKTCMELTSALGIQCFASSEFEADDIIASLAMLARQQSFAITVLTNDKDLGQLLVSADDYLLDYASNKLTDREGIKSRFGVWPEQLADFLALRGDNVDGIPGVQGIGDKSAAAILNEFASIDALYDILHERDPGIRSWASMKSQLLKNKKQLMLFRQLTRLRNDVPLSFCDVEQLKQTEPMADYFNAIGIPALVKQVNALLHAF